MNTMIDEGFSAPRQSTGLERQIIQTMTNAALGIGTDQPLELDDSQKKRVKIEAVSAVERMGCDTQLLGCALCTLGNLSCQEVENSTRTLRTIDETMGNQHRGMLVDVRQVIQ